MFVEVEISDASGSPDGKVGLHDSFTGLAVVTEMPGGRGEVGAPPVMTIVVSSPASLTSHELRDVPVAVEEAGGVGTIIVGREEVMRSVTIEYTALEPLPDTQDMVMGTAVRVFEIIKLMEETNTVTEGRYVSLVEEVP